MNEHRPLPDLSSAAASRRRHEPTRPLEKAARGGVLTRIRRGHYVDTASWRLEYPQRRHLLLVHAADASARRRVVFSHESAAALLGIPIVGGWPAVPSAVSSSQSGRKSNRVITWHQSSTLGGIAETDGYLYTDVVRTLIDLAAVRGFVSGVAAIDHVLHRPGIYGVLKADLHEAVASRRPFRNARRADAAVRFSTGLAESPGESLSMVRFYEGGFPLPRQQHPFTGLGGQQYATDFYFDDADAAGESDGWAKYHDPALLAGRSPEQAIRVEKRREDEIRAQVSAFIRWDWDDAWRGAPLFAKLERAGIRRIDAR